jgi:hypothetical protein
MLTNIQSHIITYFVEGNKWFMSVLSLLFLSILILSILSGRYAFKAKITKIDRLKNLLEYIKSLALFTLVTAIFFQFLGFVDIYGYYFNSEIKVVPKILLTGIKLTFHSTIYGAIIFLISYLIYLGLKFRIKAKT